MAISPPTARCISRHFAASRAVSKRSVFVAVAGFEYALASTEALSGVAQRVLKGIGVRRGGARGAVGDPLGPRQPCAPPWGTDGVVSGRGVAVARVCALYARDAGSALDFLRHPCEFAFRHRFRHTPSGL